MEEDLHVEKIEHKNDVDRLNAKVDCLTEEDRLLKDDNAHLKNIINNDSLPPTRKAENLPTPITAASIRGVKQEGRKDIRVQPLQKKK